MKRKKIWILLALCMLLTACAQSTEPEPGPVPEPLPEASAPEDTTPEVETLLGIELTDELSERERGWIEDLDWLGRKWEQYHPDPYFQCSKEEFLWKLERLAARVGELSDNDLFFEVNSIVIGMDEGRHTVVISPDSLMDRGFPVVLAYFGDKAYLVRYAEGFEQFAPYLLHEVVAVNGVDMAYLQKKFESFCSPNNAWYSKDYFYNFSSCPAFYDWAGCDYKEGYTFQILNEDQEVVDVEVPALLREECDGSLTWVRPENWDCLAFMKDQNLAKYIEEENGGCLYLSFHDLSHTKELAEEAGKLALAYPDCRKLIVDLRRNPGGNAEMLKYFSEHLEPLKSIEQAYVVIDGGSVSAAVACTAYFKGELDAVVIGEPTGQFTSFYSFRTSFPQIRLPFSQIEIRVADRWSELDFAISYLSYIGTLVPVSEEYYDEDGHLYDWECMILPDVYVHQDIEDIRQGKDSVIEWVLRQ